MTVKLSSTRNHPASDRNIEIESMWLVSGKGLGQSYLACSADAISSSIMAFMIRHSSGIICVAARSPLLSRLGITPMVPHRSNPRAFRYCHSVDATNGTSTGISASDRMRTVEAILDPAATSNDLHRPGHVFPVIVDRGHPGQDVPEFALSIVEQHGVAAVVLAALLNDDGSMPDYGEVKEFANRHRLNIVNMPRVRLLRGRRIKKLYG